MLCFVPFMASLVLVAARRYLTYDKSGWRGESQFGCGHSGFATLAEYGCSDQEPTEPPKAQVLRFRVDGRRGSPECNFQNVTLYDDRQICSQIKYTKYAGDASDPTIPWIPSLNSKNLSYLTFKKGDFFEIQCVLLPFQHMEPRFWSWDWDNYREPINIEWAFQFHVMYDGIDMSKNYEALVLRIENVLPAWKKEAEACQKDLKDLHNWTAHLVQSRENSHWFDFLSPKFDPGIFFDPVDLPVISSGEVFSMDERSLHLEVLSKGHVAGLNPTPGDFQEMENQVLFRKGIDVDASQLPVGTEKIEVQILVIWHSQESQNFTFQLPVVNAGVKPTDEPAKDDTTTQPDNPAKDDTTAQPDNPAKDDTTAQPDNPAKYDTTAKPSDDSKPKSSGSWFVWPVIVILLALAAAIAYVYRERLGLVPARDLRTSNASIEMQRA